jgi:hypothetical protein
MSEGGSIKNQLAQLDKELEEEKATWAKEGLPEAPMIYQFGPTQFMHHCHMVALVEVVKELGIDQDKLDLIFKRVILSELRNFRAVAHETRRAAIRQQLVDGVVIKPKVDL